MPSINRDACLRSSGQAKNSPAIANASVNGGLRHAVADDVKEPDVDRGMAKIDRERALGLRTVVRASEIDDRNLERNP